MNDLIIYYITCFAHISFYLFFTIFFVQTMCAWRKSEKKLRDLKDKIKKENK